MSDEQPGRRALNVAALSAPVMLACAIASLAVGKPTDRQADSAATTNAPAYSDNFVSGDDEQWRTTSMANVRDRPSRSGTAVLETLAAGSDVSGRLVYGSSDASTRWLRTDRGGQFGYVWIGNLIAVTPAPEPAPDPTIEPTSEPSKPFEPEPIAPTPTASATAAIGYEPAGRGEARKTRADRPREPRVLCLLPSGGEAIMGREACIDSGGVAEN